MVGRGDAVVEASGSGGGEHGRKRGRGRERKRIGSKDQRKREKDLFERWEGPIAKTQKGRRVTVKGRGWERKKPGAGLGFALGFA